MEFPQEEPPSVPKEEKQSMASSRSQALQSGGGPGTTSQPTKGQGQTSSDMRESGRESASGHPSLTNIMRGDSERSAKDEITFTKDDIPETLLKPLKILERLLAQSNCHKKQVKYKDYPFTVAQKAPEEKKTGHAE